jgi:heptosyltransferase-2
MPEPCRVVVRSPNWLGDAVMSLPCLRDVRRHFEGAFLAVAAPESLCALYRAAPGIDAVVPLEGGQAAADVARLEALHVDVGLVLPNSFGSAWTLRRARIPERWGYRSDWRSWLLTRAVPRPRRRRRAQRLHQAQYYLELARGLGMDVGPRDARLPVPAAAAGRARRLIESRGVEPDRIRIVGIAPGAAYGGAKQWPPDRVADLVARLLGRDDVVCLLLGSAADRPAARAIVESLRPRHESRLPARLIDLVGQTDLDLLIGLLGASDVVVSNDSGAMHLAAVVGARTVAIFGPTDEHATSPLGRSHRLLVHDVGCRPCLLRECPIDHRCMTGVTVQMVEDAVGEALDEG